jgi:hypothetical protein
MVDLAMDALDRRILDLAVACVVMVAVACLFLLVLSGCGRPPCHGYQTPAGACVVNADPSWLSEAELALEELEAAQIVGDQFQLDPAQLLLALEDVRVTMVTGDEIRCGQWVAMGCTRTFADHSEIEVLRTGSCARQDSTYRHEAAHVMLNSIYRADNRHTVTRMWRLLDKRGNCEVTP